MYLSALYLSVLAGTGEFKETFDFKFEELGLTLPNGITIMKGVNGTIRHGKVTAVMGPSGAGKTTFLTLLSGPFRLCNTRLPMQMLLS